MIHHNSNVQITKIDGLAKGLTDIVNCMGGRCILARQRGVGVVVNHNGDKNTVGKTIRTSLYSDIKSECKGVIDHYNL